MSRIIFQKSYIIVLPSFASTAAHRHPFLHLFCGADGCRISAADGPMEGSCILTGPHVQHAVPTGSGIGFFLLIDPTSRLAERIQSRYLQNRASASIPCAELPPAEVLNTLPDELIVQYAEAVLAQLGLSSEPGSMADERVSQVVENIISGQWLEMSVREIAARVYLSESRLTHLFKENAGISLKSYLVIRRLEKAYRFITSGGRMTRAAHESGFASSAHLAYTCKKLTGISVSEVLKKTADF